MLILVKIYSINCLFVHFSHPADISSHKRKFQIDIQVYFLHRIDCVFVSSYLFIYQAQLYFPHSGV